jgi:hypothetical protein
VELHDDENAWSSKNHSILFDDNVLQTCHGYAKINEPIFLLFLSCASTSVILARVTRALCYNLKGTVSRDFCIKFFHESSSPKPLKITKVISNFFENSWRYSHVKVHHRSHSTPPAANFATVTALPPVSMILAASLPPFALSTIPLSTTPAVTVAKFAAGLVDTSGK